MSAEKKCIKCGKTLIVGEKIFCKRCGDNAKDIGGKILSGLLIIAGLLFGGKKIADNMSSNSIDLDEEDDEDEDDE